MFDLSSQSKLKLRRKRRSKTVRIYTSKDQILQPRSQGPVLLGPRVGEDPGNEVADTNGTVTVLISFGLKLELLELF